MTEDYLQRLAARVGEWEAKNPDQAAALRAAVLQESGAREAPPIGGVLWQTLEWSYREKVRVLKGWPTEREWRSKNAS